MKREAASSLLFPSSSSSPLALSSRPAISPPISTPGVLSLSPLSSVQYVSVLHACELHYETLHPIVASPFSKTEEFVSGGRHSFFFLFFSFLLWVSHSLAASSCVSMPLFSVIAKVPPLLIFMVALFAGAERSEGERERETSSSYYSLSMSVWSSSLVKQMHLIADAPLQTGCTRVGQCSLDACQVIWQTSEPFRPQASQRQADQR